jgi:retron-type reverse transcriptase
LSLYLKRIFSNVPYGFRPKRSALQAIDKIYEVADVGDALWVIDADIKDYFGSINHEKLMLNVVVNIQILPKTTRFYAKIFFTWNPGQFNKKGL